MPTTLAANVASQFDFKNARKEFGNFSPIEIIGELEGIAEIRIETASGDRVIKAKRIQGQAKAATRTSKGSLRIEDYTFTGKKPEKITSVMRPPTDKSPFALLNVEWAGGKIGCAKARLASESAKAAATPAQPAQPKPPEPSGVELKVAARAAFTLNGLDARGQGKPSWLESWYATKARETELIGPSLELLLLLQKHPFPGGATSDCSKLDWTVAVLHLRKTIAAHMAPTETPATATHATQPDPTKVAVKTDSDYEAAFRASPELKKEFVSAANYAAYARNQPGAVKASKAAEAQQREALVDKVMANSPAARARMKNFIGESSRRTVETAAGPEKQQEQYTAEYEASTDLQGEFPSCESYCCFMRAQARGQVKVLTR